MRRKNRPVGIAVATATLLLSTSLSFGGAAFAAPNSGDAGTTKKIDQTSTGVAAGANVPSGAVMVVLNDQLTDTPATSAHVAARKSDATSQQNQVLASAGISAKNVKHFTLVNGFATTITPVQAKKLAADPRVKSISPDVQTTAPAAASATSGTASSAKSKQTKSPKGATADSKGAATAASNQLCPANPKKPLLEPEALSVIKAANQTGAPSAQQISTGKGVKVAVMAEGIDPSAPDYRRPDGTSAIVDYQNFSGAPDSAVQYGDEIFGDASSIAAQGTVVHDLSQYVNIAHALPEGCNIQIKGVAPGASIVALNILGGGSGDNDSPSFAFASNIAQAIDYAVTVQHVDILSESIGSNQIPDQGARSAVQAFNDAAVAQGVTVFASTGDAGVTGTMGDPAVDPLVIGVGATTALRSYQQVGYSGTLLSKNHTWLNGNIATFSSGGFGQAGNLPVIVAPGDSGWAACTDKTDKPGCTDLSGNPSSIELFGGTSESAPFTAGVGALVIQAYKDGHQGIAPSPAQVRQILTGTATNLGAPGQQQGVGQVDALAAVQLAKTFQSPTGAGTNAITVNQDQLQVTGAPGQSVSQTVTVNNASNKKVKLTPSVKSLKAVGSAVTGSTAIAANGPSFLSAGAAKTTYKTVTFKVPASVDQYTFQFTFGPKATDSDQNQVSGVAMSLISPSGQYVGNTRPQSGTSYLGSPMYGRFDVVHPQAGTWTAVFTSGPSQIDQIGSGAPTPTPTYTGPIDYKATMNRWVDTGSVSAKSVTVAAHSSAAFTATNTLPAASGDSSLTVFLGAPAGFTAPTIPISQRVLVPLTAKGGSFSGTMTGGNGRGNAPASQDTFAMNIPAGKKSLQVKVGFSQDYETQGLRVALIDPNGVLQSIQANQNVTDGTDGNSVVSGGSSAIMTAANPIAGRWRVVVWQLVATIGRQITTPYSGAVTFNDSGVSSPDLNKASVSGSALMNLPTGQQQVFKVSITNKSDIPQKYVIDPRTASLVAITYPSYSSSMPSTVLDAFGILKVPAQTSRVDATISAPVAVQSQLAGPGVFPALAGMTSVGTPAQPVNGVAQSTASLSTRSGQLTVGAYGTQAGSVGPFGSAGAPHAKATVTPTLYTAGFDTSVITDGGDPYAVAALGGSVPATPLLVQPGKSVQVAVRVAPQAAVGTTVNGRINVIQLGNTGTFSAIIPYILSTDQVVDSFDYRYKVTKAASQLSGKVTGLAAVPLAGVTVKVFDAAGVLAQSQLTATDGSYAIGGLLTGSKYRVCFDTSTLGSSVQYLSECYKGQAWDGKSASPATAQSVVAPAAGTPLSGIDAQLAANGAISGLVTDPAGKPVTGAYVMLGSEHGVADFSTIQLTDADGRYTFKGLTTDPVVCVMTSLLDPTPANPRGLVSQCDGVAWGSNPTSAVPPSAKAITLEPGATVNYNIALQAGASISGKITKPDGTPAAGADVIAVTADGQAYGRLINIVGDDGSYTVPGLPSMPVSICAVLGNAQLTTCAPAVPYGGGGEPLPAGTRFITPAVGGAIAGVDFALLPSAVGSTDGVNTANKASDGLLQKIHVQLKAQR